MPNESHTLYPMLANAITIDDIARKAAGYTMEIKLDGVRCLVEKTSSPNPLDSSDPVVRLYTRTRHDATMKVLSLAEEIEATFEDDFILDGELGYWVPERVGVAMDFNKTMRVIGSGEDEAIRKQQENAGSIVFCAFDILQLNGVPLVREPQGARRSILERVVYEVPLGRVQLTYAAEGWNEDFYNSVVELGGEGVILKNPDAPYIPGKRPTKTWYKVKKFETLNAQITGYLQGQGKYANQIGAICFMSEEGVEGKCSGITDDLRAAISTEPHSYLNRQFEFKHFGKVGKGQEGCRHPQWYRWRPTV